MVSPENPYKYDFPGYDTERQWPRCRAQWELNKQQSATITEGLRIKIAVEVSWYTDYNTLQSIRIPVGALGTIHVFKLHWGKMTGVVFDDYPHPDRSTGGFHGIREKIGDVLPGWASIV